MQTINGITLVALVVTIIVLIILATISIYAILGENGIIARAERAKDTHEEGKQEEQNRLDYYGEYIGNYTNGNGGGTTTEYNDNTLPVAPRLSEGMTKVKYNSESQKWEKVEDDSTEWYNYDNKEWANVVLGDATWNADGTLDESKAYIQLVWIPRFAYKIKTQYHTSGSTAGEIDIVFVDSNNQNKSKTTTYKAGKENYPTVASGEMNDFIVHPAFDYDGKHLTGFWMGKFESSNTNCTTTASTGEAGFTGSEVMCVRPNVTSWRNIKIGDAFTTCLNMNKEGNPYELPTSDSVVDPHMVKNDEWGAVAYLSKSKYGKQTEEVFINNSSDFITGNAGGTASAGEAAGVINAYNTTNGVKASTTGNITGIYDMSGGNFERVAAYINNGHGNLTTNGADLVNGLAKYKNVYTSTVSDGSNAQVADYALIDPTDVSKRETAHYGDAVWETSSSHTSTNCWYSDYSYFPYSNSPFFFRGGYYSYMSYAGVFFFGNDLGSADSSDGFRVVVPVP